MHNNILLRLYMHIMRDHMHVSLVITLPVFSQLFTQHLFNVCNRSSWISALSPPLKVRSIGLYVQYLTADCTVVYRYTSLQCMAKQVFHSLITWDQVSLRGK